MSLHKFVVMSRRHIGYDQPTTLWYDRIPTLIFTHSTQRVYPLASLVRPAIEANAPSAFCYTLFVFYSDLTELSCARPPQ